jgi:hypothetical protein
VNYWCCKRNNTIKQKLLCLIEEELTLNRNQLLGKINKMRKKIEGKLDVIRKIDHQVDDCAGSSNTTSFLAVVKVSARCYRISVPKIVILNLGLEAGDLIEIKARKVEDSELLETPACYGRYNCNSSCKARCPHEEGCKELFLNNYDEQ